MEKKMRVWYMILGLETYYVPVETPEEAQRTMDILGSYSQFLINQNAIGDHCSTCGLEVFDEESGEWEDWHYEDEENYYDSVDDYIEEMSTDKEKLSSFSTELYSQVTF